MTHSIAPSEARRFESLLGDAKVTERKLSEEVEQALQALEQALEGLEKQSLETKNDGVLRAILAIKEQAGRDAANVNERIMHLQSEIARDELSMKNYDIKNITPMTQGKGSPSKNRSKTTGNRVKEAVQQFHSALKQVLRRVPELEHFEALELGTEEVDVDVDVEPAELVTAEASVASNTSEELSPVAERTPTMPPPAPERTPAARTETIPPPAPEHITPAAATETATNEVGDLAIGTDENRVSAPSEAVTETSDSAAGPDSIPPESIEPPEDTEGRVTIIPDAREDNEVISHRETLPPPPIHATETAHGGDEYIVTPVVAPSRTETLPPPAPDMIEGMAKDGEGLELVAQELGTALPDYRLAEQQRNEVPLRDGDLANIRELLANNDSTTVQMRMAALADSSDFLAAYAQSAKQDLVNPKGDGAPSGDLLYPSESVIRIVDLQVESNKAQRDAYLALENIRSIDAERADMQETYDNKVDVAQTVDGLIKKVTSAPLMLHNIKTLDQILERDDVTALISAGVISIGEPVREGVSKMQAYSKGLKQEAVHARDAGMQSIEKRLKEAHAAYLEKMKAVHATAQEVTRETERMKSEIAIRKNEYARNADTTLNQFKNQLVYDVHGEEITVSEHGKASQYAQQYAEQAAYATEYVRYNRSLERYGKPFDTWAKAMFTGLAFAGARGLSTEEKAALTKSREGLVRQDRSFAMHSHAAARNLNELNKASTRSYGASPYHVERIKAAPNRASGQADKSSFFGMIKNTLSGGGFGSIWNWMRGKE